MGIFTHHLVGKQRHSTARITQQEVGCQGNFNFVAQPLNVNNHLMRGFFQNIALYPADHCFTSCCMSLSVFMACCQHRDSPFGRAESCWRRLPAPNSAEY